MHGHNFQINVNILVIIRYEKECLFIVGHPMMIITNIINVITMENYGKYINAINVINSIFKMGHIQ